ncbi:immunity 8 family protein [Nonomuraea sp. NPDC050202]|uniref:immunity 8 family protein n=1 Tax=Nonomuraea sp. NPDC050202 TaxID=3155035 RepID=UPI00340360ED
MKAEIKGFHSPDVNWEGGAPADPQNFGILLQLFIGPKDAPGSESFDLIVCTPSWLGQIVKGGPIIGRHHLVVSTFDVSAIASYLKAEVANYSAPDWEQLAGKLTRIGRWEFEDYVEEE